MRHRGLTDLSFLEGELLCHECPAASEVDDSFLAKTS